MRGNHHRDSQLAVHAEKRVQEVLLRHRVKLGRRLVEQQQPGLHGKDAGQREHLLLASRKLGHLTPEPRLDAEEMRDLGHATAHLVLRNAQVFQPEGKLVPHGVAHDLVLGALGNVAHARSRRERVHVLDGNAERLERPVLRPNRRDSLFQAAQQRGLSAAGRSDQQLERPFGHPPIKRPYRCRGIGIRKGEPARLDGGPIGHDLHTIRSLASMTSGKAANST